MHINITAQKIGKNHQTYNSSVTDYVNYLEKENEGNISITTLPYSESIHGN